MHVNRVNFDAIRQPFRYLRFRNIQYLAWDLASLSGRDQVEALRFVVSVQLTILLFCCLQSVFGDRVVNPGTELSMLGHLVAFLTVHPANHEIRDVMGRPACRCLRSCQP